MKYPLNSGQDLGNAVVPVKRFLPHATNRWDAGIVILHFVVLLRLRSPFAEITRVLASASGQLKGCQQDARSMQLVVFHDVV
jgi:hypothetical protein